MKFLNRFTLALMIGFFSLEAHATTEITLQACVQNRLSARRGFDGCWAQLAWDRPGKNGVQEWGRVCVSKQLWQEMLHSGGARCGTWKGKWKIYSPPLNVPSGRDEKKPPKEMLRSFQVKDFPREVASPAERVVRWIERSREQADGWITPHDRTGVLRELLTGTKPEGGSLQLLGLLGFVHLLLAAGIHLYALAGCVHWALRTLAIRIESLPLVWAKRAAALITTVVWVSAWLLEGGRPGMLRPWIVVCLRIGARRLGFRWRRLAPLGLALAIDLAVAVGRGELGGPHGHGRWVYALACGGGLIARSAPWAAVGSWILAAWLEAAHAGTVALTTPLLSAVTVPLYAGVIYPLLLLAWAFRSAGFTELGDTLGWICGRLSEASVRELTGVAMQTGSMWTVGPVALLGGLALGAFSLGARRRTRVAALMVLLVARWGAAEWGSSHVALADMRPLQVQLADQVHQLDIGQGDAALVRGHGPGGTENIGLIDVGPERGLGDRAWMELLSRFGVRQVDWVALTHLDEDHVGGLKRLALLVRVRCVATAREQLESERGRIFSDELARAGVRVTSWEGGCVPYPVLGPPQDPRSKSKSNGSMSAIFVPLRGGGFYLSAGDADSRDEPRIGFWAAALAQALRVDDFNRPSSRGEVPRILKVSHHGSRTSSNPVFLNAVKPTEAWISSGAGNRHGHPTAIVLDTLSGLRIPVRRTDEEGALTINAMHAKK